MGKINAVIVSDNIDLRIEVKNLTDPERFAVCGYSSFGSEAKTKIINLFPEIVICACRGTVKDSVFDFIQDLLSTVHTSTFMLAADNITAELVNKAAQYGVRKVIPLDGITPEQFSNEVSTAYDLEQQRSLDTNEAKKVRSKVLGFFGGKGGTGKTTLAVNIASLLAKAGKRVILLDLDLQFGDVAISLDIDAKNSIIDLVQDRGGITIENINNFSVEHAAGMSVLCAPKSSEFADYIKPEHVEKIIDIMRPYYEYIIIDLPSVFDDCTITACEGCEELYLIYNCDILSLKNAKVCFNVLDQLHQKDKIRFVINRCEKGLIKPEDFVKMFSTEIFAQVPDDAKAVVTCINKGQPVAVAQPSSPASKAIRDMTDKIADIHSGFSVIEEEPKKKRFSKGKKK